MLDLPTASSVHKPRVLPGISNPFVNFDQWADYCLLYQRLPPEKQREFWTLQGDRAMKQGFLLRWGRFEQEKEPV